MPWTLSSGFDVAGINDIPNFLGGAKSLAEGTATVGVTGMYQAGFFPVMMFGLPGAALAIYLSAKPSQRTKVASIMLAGAFASFFTGITEPLEFSFMFVAPVLYFIHAVLTGIFCLLSRQQCIGSPARFQCGSRGYGTFITQPISRWMVYANRTRLSILRDLLCTLFRFDNLKRST